jgi:hypothetical protein
MKGIRFFAVLSLGLFLFTGCKKNNTIGATASITVNPDGSVNFPDADGTLYAVQVKSYDTYNGTSYSASQVANAWFGTFPNITDAGIVKANSKVLTNTYNYYNAMAFLNSGDTLFTGNGATVTWNVQGNTISGVPAFSHTDNAALPAGPEFTLPTAININNSITINHTATTGNIGVIYTLSGSKGDTTKFIASSSSSITFSSTEVQAVAVSSDYISLSVMPVNYTSAVYSGKKYYFVKLLQYRRETITQ